MNKENEPQELNALEEDVIRKSEDLEDVIRGDEHLGVLKRIRSRWKAAALTSILLFLMTILYACGSARHSDTIVPTSTVPEQGETATAAPPVGDGIESIEVYEYVIKPDGITPDFTEDLLIPDSIGLIMNVDAIEAYGKSYTVNWIVEKGDDDFTAERQAGKKVFFSDKPLSSFTNGSIISNICGETLINKALIAIEPGQEDVGGVETIAVILPESYSEDEILNGVSTFLEKFKGLNWRLSGEQDTKYQYHSRRYWDILDKSQEDMIEMLGDSFGMQGYLITSNPEQGDIKFLGEGDKTTIESEYIKDGDKIVFINYDRFSMNSDVTAAFYSKYLQGDSSLKVFDSYNDLDSFLALFPDTIYRSDGN